MHAQGISSFPYFVGIDSLADVATRGDRVCVLNILGGESRQVTPTSHVFSGGNVAFGTSPGRGGQKLRTPVGDVPVFNSVREGLNAGHRFNTGVVYLPPAAVRDGVAELVRVNPDLAKIVVVTEKVSVHDAREIRAIGQTNGIDIFGANGLGVADSWNQVRIGGALGGDKPGDSLRPGSIAIFSVMMKILRSSALTRISSATPSRAADGGRYTTPQLKRYPSSMPSRTLL